MMMRALQHVTYTPSDETTRVKHLLKSIVSNAMTIIAAITAIIADNTKLTDFDESSDILVTTSPPSKNLDTDFHNISAFTTNTGRTGVELRYHKRYSFERLSDEQKQEGQSWREKETKNNFFPGNHGSRHSLDRERCGGKRRDRSHNRGRPDQGSRNISSIQTHINDLTKMIKSQSQTIVSFASKDDTTNANKLALRKPDTV